MQVSGGGVAASKHVRLRGSGTYTAADFAITRRPTYTNPNVESVATQQTFGGLPFKPTKVKVVNLTDRNESHADRLPGETSFETNGLKVVAAGTRTFAAHGVSLRADGGIGIDVSVAGPITDNDTFEIEAWGED